MNQEENIKMKHQTLVLGIGNNLLTDEGAGIYAMNLLESLYEGISDILFLDGGTLSFTLAAWIEDCNNLIVFDAAELHQPAGAVCTFTGREMDEFLGKSKRSAHEVGLLDLMDIARITDTLPENRAIIGIQPEKMGWGTEPTKSVQEALSQAVEEGKNLIRRWHKIEKSSVTVESCPEQATQLPVDLIELVELGKISGASR